jgi:hypothetical protein
MREMNSEAVLCYVDGAWAYFTTQELSQQWGDDWDDSPYYCNAGSPYGSDSDEWEIVKIAFDGPFETPEDTRIHWSVERINNKEIPWLWDGFEPENSNVRIWAGTSLNEFVALVRSAGGSVYLKWDR